MQNGDCEIKMWIVKLEMTDWKNSLADWIEIEKTQYTLELIFTDWNWKWNATLESNILNKYKYVYKI